MKAMLARAVAVIGLLLHHGAWSAAQGQFLPSLQAEEPAEFDAYLAILQAGAPEARLTAADRFAQAWPKSQLLPHVYELRFDAERERGDTQAAIDEGRRALAAAPSNVTVGVRLAGILANEGQIEEAERLLRQTDEVLATFRVPRTLPFQEWQTRERWIRARAAVARGLIAFKQDRVGDSVAQFEEAVRLAPEPADHLRLGKLYRLVERDGDARRQFELAAQAGDALVRDLALAELKRRP